MDAQGYFAARLAEGAAGIKILPMYIGVYPADRRMAVVWEEADRRALTVLTLATAEIPGEARQIWVSERLTDIHHPNRFEDVVRSYPRLRLVLADPVIRAESRTPSAWPTRFRP